MKATISKLAAAILLAATIVMVGCRNPDDPHCIPKEVGEVSMDGISKEFFSGGDTTRLFFKNEAGEEMRFKCVPIFSSGYTGVNVDPRCFHLSNLATDYDYVTAEAFGLICRQDTFYSKPAEFKMELVTKNARIDSKENTSLYDVFTAVFGNDAQANFGGAEINYVTSDRGTDAATLQPYLDAQKFRHIADTTILGKQFSDLIVAVPTFGTMPTDKFAFFYQKNVGPAAFSLKDGTAYVFDREE